MNSLSWLIYGIQLTSNVGAFLAITSGLFLLTLGLIFVVRCITIDNDYNSKDATKALKYAEARKNFRKLFWIPLLGIFLACVIPNERTMYLIAASEIGERIVKTETVQRVVDPSIDLLKNWIAKENQRIMKSMNEESK